MNLQETVNHTEKPVVFNCHSEKLFGVVHLATNTEKLGILIVVGGPQYRVGSHRQFILLARMLAKNGVSVMRFDYRGMGDSEGEIHSFENIDDDIKAAIDAFYISCPSLSGVIIWGLCDAASAALFYAYQDERIIGLVLLNPWVFTEQGSAKVYLKHYYLNRLLTLSFWKKIITLRFNYKNSIFSMLGFVGKMAKKSESKQILQPIENRLLEKKNIVNKNFSLPERMCESLERFSHPVLLILSGNDLTAEEFKETVSSNLKWQKLLKQDQVTRFDIDDADHTFSSVQWRDQVAIITFEWVKKLQDMKIYRSL